MADGEVRIEITGDASDLTDALDEAAKKAKYELQGSLKGLTPILNEIMQDAAKTGKKTSDALEDAADAADDAQDALEDAADAADELADELGDTADATKKAGKQLDNLEDELDDVGRSAEKAGKQGTKLGTIFKGAFFANIATQALGKLKDALVGIAKSMITNAAEYRALNSQYEQTFGELGDQADAAVRRVAEASGIVESRLKGSAASVYAFARSSGGSTEEAMSLMETSLQAAADAAAYYDRSLEDTTETLQSFLKGNFANDAALGVSCTETTRNAAAMELFGQKFADLSEIQKQQTLLKMVTDAQALSGAMGQAAREAEGWENVTGNLKAVWGEFLAKVGTPVLDALIPVLQGVTDKLIEITENIDWDQFGETVSTVLGGIIDGLVWITEHGDLAAAALTGIVTAVNPVVGVIAIIAQAVLAFNQAVDEGTDSLSPWQEALLGLAPATSGLAQGLHDAQHEAELATDLTGQNLRELEGIVEEQTTGYVRATSDMSEASIQTSAAMGEAFIGAGDTIKGAFAGISETGQLMKDDLMHATQILGAEFSAAKDKIVTAAGNAGTGIKTAFANAKDGVQSAWSGISGFFSDVWETIKGVFANVWSDFCEIGKQILQGLEDGILAGIRGAVAAAQKVVSAVKGVFTGAKGFDVNSPSKWADDVGKYIDQGLANGLGDHADEVKKAAQEVVDTSKRALDAFRKAFQSGIQGIIDDHAKATQEILDRQERLASRLGETGELFTQTLTGSALGKYGGIDGLMDDLGVYDAYNDIFRRLKERGVSDSFLADWMETDMQAAIEYGEKLLQLPPGKYDEYLELFEQRKQASADTAAAIEAEQARFTTLADLQDDIDRINAYGDAMRALRDRGASDSLFAEIRDMDEAEATAYANALLDLSDEAWDDYLAAYKEKGEAAKRVAEEIFQPDKWALDEQLQLTLPGKLEDVGTEAMDALAQAIGEEGQAAIDASAFVANSIIAELERINLMERLGVAANEKITSMSASMASSAAAGKEARDAELITAAVNQVSAAALAGIGTGGTEVNMQVDGITFARLQLPYNRMAEAQSPKVVSDFG